MPLDSRGVSASSFSVEETSNNSGEAPGNFERAACDLDKTDSTSENGQHQPEEQQPENNGATTGSHSTSETEGSIGTIETGEASFGTHWEVLTFLVSNPVLFREDKDDSRKDTSSRKSKRQNPVTSRYTPRSSKRRKQSAGSLDNQLLEHQHENSNGGFPEQHEGVEKPVESSGKLKPSSQTRDLRLIYLL